MTDQKSKGMQVTVTSWPFGPIPTQHHEATYYLTRWFFQAAKAEFRHAGTEADVASPKVVHRVAAVFFMAAAFDSFLNRIRDELFEPHTSSLPIVDDHGLVADALKPIARGPWRQKLGIYTFLSSAGNRWMISKDLPALKVVGELMDLRNRLIHAPPEKEEWHGDRETAGIHVHNVQNVPFGTGPEPDLPAEILRQLSLQTLEGYLTAAEELIHRIDSLRELYPEGTDRPHRFVSVQAVDQDGSKPWIEDIDNPKGHQIRWCASVSSYVLHTFAASPSLKPLTIDEGTRVCRNAPRCERALECTWPAIRAAAEAANTSK